MVTCLISIYSCLCPGIANSNIDLVKSTLLWYFNSGPLVIYQLPCSQSRINSRHLRRRNVCQFSLLRVVKWEFQIQSPFLPLRNILAPYVCIFQRHNYSQVQKCLKAWGEIMYIVSVKPLIGSWSKNRNFFQ